MFYVMHYVYYKFLRENWNLPLNFEYFHVNVKQHVGCRFLCYLSLAKLYYDMIDLDHDSKVVQGV